MRERALFYESENLVSRGGFADTVLWDFDEVIHSASKFLSSEKEGLILLGGSSPCRAEEI